MPNFHTSFAYRLGRTLLPSPMSAALCLCVGITMVCIYLLVLSVSLGTSLPSLFDGEWGISYTNHIVQPLLSIFNDLTFNKIVFLGLWGLAGLATYFGLEYIVRLFKNAHSAEHDIQLTPRGIIRHPAISSFFVAALWRAGVLVVFMPLLALAVKLPLEQLSAVAPEAVLGNLSTSRTIMQLGLLVAAFGLLSHGIVVFLRLFAMRMRLFNDDPV
jgi:hypothetical protein